MAMTSSPMPFYVTRKDDEVSFLRRTQPETVTVSNRFKCITRMSAFFLSTHRIFKNVIFEEVVFCRNRKMLRSWEQLVHAERLKTIKYIFGIILNSIGPSLELLAICFQRGQNRTIYQFTNMSTFHSMLYGSY